MLEIASRRLVFLYGSLPYIEKVAMALVNANLFNANLVDANSGLKRDYPVKKMVPWVATDLPVSLTEFSDIECNIEHVHISQAIRLLGSTRQLLAYISERKFDPNLLAAAAGILAENGCMIVGVADIDQNSHYLRYFFRVLERSRDQYPASFNIHHCVNKKPELEAILDSHEPLTTVALKNLDAPTDEQALFLEQAFERLQVAFSTQKQSCIMLRGRRGRGKTQALAWLVEHCLITDAARRVFICAPSRKQAEPFFSILKEKSDLQKRMLYHSLDHLLDIIDRDDRNFLKEQDVLVIDEAAAVPLSLLKKIADRGFNLVLATTTEGYEGSGRGFLLRYTEYLRRHYPNFFDCLLQQSIRWTDQDRLEPFIDSVCGLHWSQGSRDDLIEELPDLEFDQAALMQTVKIRKIVFNDDGLSDRERESIYALLVSSHYQTRPSDLQRLFDAPDHHLWVAELEGSSRFHPIGALLALEEGGFADQGKTGLAEQVAMGVRRPKGNLVAQKLASFFCAPEWCVQNSLRVSRIVVDRKFQRQGVATQMLHAMERFATSRSVGDSFRFWSSSFGFNEEISKFWLAAGASLIHLGHKYDKASGERSGIVVKVLAEQSSAIEIERMNFFKQVFTADLKLSQADYQVFAMMSPGQGVINEAKLGQLDQARLSRFIDGAIDWESSYPSFLRLLDQTPRKNFRYQSKDISLDSLRNALVQNWPNAKASADSLGLTGRPQLLDLIRSVLRSSLRSSLPSSLRGKLQS